MSSRLRPSEILFLWYADGKSNLKNKYPQYWALEYGVDVEYEISVMLQEKYLQYAPLEYSLAKRTIPELRNALTKYDLPYAGKKETLIERITSNIPQENILEQFPERYLFITNKGKSIIEKYPQIIYAHQHKSQFGLSPDNVASLIEEYPAHNTYSLFTKYFESCAQVEFNDGNYGLGRNYLYLKSLIYHDFGSPSDEFHTLISVCYLDLSGGANGNRFEKRLSFLAPGIISSIKDLISNNNFSSNDAIKIFEDVHYTFVPEYAKHWISTSIFYEAIK